MQRIKALLASLGSYGLLAKQILIGIVRFDFDLAELNKQLVRMGATSVPIVMLTAAFTGMVLALQTAYGLQRFGAKNYVANIVGLALVRELGPVLTAIMICGRAGAGMAAEIASMVASEQVDAIKALGGNPVRQLVTPKVLAAILAMPLLAVFADFIGIYGGALVAVYELNISAHMYYSSIKQMVVIRDVFDGLIKSAFFGFLLSSIACYKGLSSFGGTEGVGLTTRASVVISSIMIFVSDFFITKLLIMIG